MLQKRRRKKLVLKLKERQRLNAKLRRNNVPQRRSVLPRKKPKLRGKRRKSANVLRRNVTE